MKSSVVSAGLLLLGRYANAQISCYSCTHTLDAYAEDTELCWNPTSGTTPTTTCSADSPDTVARCMQSIEFKDGFPISITRGCELYDGPLSVETANLGQELAGYETNGQTCTQTIARSRPWFGADQSESEVDYATATCMTDCSTADCNSGFTLRALNVCNPTEVGTADLPEKWCDFTTGTWYCRSTFGSVAAVANTQCTAITAAPAVNAPFAPISCVQCNSATDADCFTKTTATACETNAYVSCNAETAITYHKNTGEKLREAIVRGCSMVAATHTAATPVFDQCHWTSNTADTETNFQFEKNAKDSQWAAEIQLACVATCNPTNNPNCNVVPNGMQDETQEKLIRCATFTYDSSAVGTRAVANTYMFGDANIEVCQPGVTQCYSEVEYLDRAHQDYIDNAQNHGFEAEVLVHRRGCGPIAKSGCAQDAWTASTNVPTLDVHKYTCAETCSGDLCNNNNWPNRPKCYQSAVGNPMACTSPAHSACSIVEANLISGGGRYKKFVEDHLVGDAGKASYMQDLGFSTTVMRGCLHHAAQIPTGCTKVGWRPAEPFYYNNELFVENCNYTCSHDGCNFGTGYSGSFVQSMSAMSVMVALLVKTLL